MRSCRAGGAPGPRAAWPHAATDPDPAVRRRAAELAPHARPRAGRRPAGAARRTRTALVAETAAWALGRDRLGRTAPGPGSSGRWRRRPRPRTRSARPRVRGRGTRRDRRPAGAARDPHRLRRPAPDPAPGRARARARSTVPPSTPRSTAALTDTDWQVRQAAEDLTADGRYLAASGVREPASSWRGGRSRARAGTTRSSGAGAAHEHVLQAVEGLEAAAGAEHDALERRVDEVDRQRRSPSRCAGRGRAASRRRRRGGCRAGSGPARARAGSAASAAITASQIARTCSSIALAHLLGREDDRLRQPAHEVAAADLGLVLVRRSGTRTRSRA